MKTSDLERVLRGSTDWQSFCALYQAEKIRLLSRKDGAATSGDLGLSFDSGQVVVTGEQIEKLCKVVFAGGIDPSDAQFSATVIALSGFDFDNDDTEDAVHLLSTPNSGGLDRIQEAIQMLNLGNSS